MLSALPVTMKHTMGNEDIRAKPGVKGILQHV